MLVFFEKEKLASQINDLRICAKIYGAAMQTMIHRRLNELIAAPNLETMRGLGDCHELHGPLKGHFAIDLVRLNRMVFKPTALPETYTEDSCIIWKKIESVTIVGIGDYHK